MAKKKILLAGESWVSTATHIKGFDQLPTVTYHTGADELLAALKNSDFDASPSCRRTRRSAISRRLSRLCPPMMRLCCRTSARTRCSCIPIPDPFKDDAEPSAPAARLCPERRRLADVRRLLQLQGINGGARYRKTPVEEVLPVECLSVDDRVEVPEGFAPVVTGNESHPILAGLGKDWPVLLGFNEVIVKDAAEVLATVSSDYGSLPLLVTGRYGKGRTVALTSDVGPHWLPPGFIAWSGYKALFEQMLAFATAKD